MSLESYLLAAPKAELHVHLEGAIPPAVMLELANRNRITLPHDNVEGLRDWFQYRDFTHFIEIYLAITSCFKVEEDYDFIVYEVGRELARQNARYAEITFSPSSHWSMGIPFATMFRGLNAGRERALTELGVEINWIFDIVRNHPGPEIASSVVDWAIDGMHDGILALGLAGMEEGHPPEPFARHFDRAVAAGLHSDPHAGEHAGPESIWGAIRALHAERIGHGVRSIEDPELVRYLADHHIPLEVNPTSNIKLGVYPSYDAHPLRKLYEAGVPLTINSDDPPLFNTTLNDEVRLLDSAFHFDIAQVDDILLNGIRHSFIEPERKAQIEAEWQQELDDLKQVHLS